MEKARNVDIRQFYREDLGVHSEELLDKLEAVSQAVTLQKGEILNKKGERQTMLPFLIEGMMRCVTLDREGKEKTVGFTMNRGDVVLSNMDLTGCHISTDQAMVPSTLILLPIDYVLQNMKDEPEVIRVYQEQRGTTVLLVSHSMEDIAKYADRVLVMSNKKIAMYDTVEQVFARAPELLALGLSVPQVTKIFLKLREMGVDVPADVYTVPYAVKMILEAKQRRDAGESLVLPREQSRKGGVSEC